jgi:hypothetical protein
MCPRGDLNLQDSGCKGMHTDTPAPTLTRPDASRATIRDAHDYTRIHPHQYHGKYQRAPRWLRLAGRLAAADGFGLVGPPGHNGQDGQLLQRLLLRPLIAYMRGHVPDSCERALGQEMKPLLA